MENDKITKSFKTIISEWIIIICDTLLFSSALNCLFLSLSYAKIFDISLFVLSLGLAIYVYLYAMNIKRTPILKKRLIIAISSIIVWIVLIPVLYNSL